VSKEKFIIEIDTSKLTNTLIQLRVDAYTKALWQYKLTNKQKRAVKKAIIKLIKQYAELQLPEPEEVNIVINAVVTDEKESESDTEFLTKQLDIMKRKLNLCEEEVKVLKWENRKVKEYEDKLKVYEDKLKQIQKKIALYQQGTVPDLKTIIKEIDRILSQA
jgi:hypothetical protein